MSEFEHTQLLRPSEWDPQCAWLRPLDTGEPAERGPAIGWMGFLAGHFQTHHLLKPQPG